MSRLVDQRYLLEQASQAVRVYQRIPIRFVDVELAEALQIADAQGICAYDAYLIRCAVKYGAPLLSLDRGLVAAARDAGTTVLEVAT